MNRKLTRKDGRRGEERKKGKHVNQLTDIVDTTFIGHVLLDAIPDLDLDGIPLDSLQSRDVVLLVTPRYTEQSGT